MKTRIVRVAEGKQSTLSHLYIDGIFQCFRHIHNRRNLRNTDSRDNTGGAN
mgnify:CR=1 FL=1